MRLWRRKRTRPEDPDPARVEAAEEAAPEAAPVQSDEVPAEVCTAIDCASVFERDGPDGEGQTIVMMPGFGVFEMQSREGVARRIGKARPNMSEAACLKAARMLAGRARETRRMRDERPALRRMTVAEMHDKFQIG